MKWQADVSHGHWIIGEDNLNSILPDCGNSSEADEKEAKESKDIRGILGVGLFSISVPSACDNSDHHNNNTEDVSHGLKEEGTNGSDAR